MSLESDFSVLHEVFFNLWEKPSDAITILFGCMWGYGSFQFERRQFEML